jgi:hypothetical protein
MEQDPIQNKSFMSYNQVRQAKELFMDNSHMQRWGKVKVILLDFWMA